MTRCHRRNAGAPSPRFARRGILSPRLCLLALGLGAPVLPAASAFAAIEFSDDDAPGGDYDVAAPGWNALTYLRATATEANVALASAPSLDFSALRGNEVLLVIGPLVRLDAAAQGHLRAFVEAGGRLVVADDFRAGASWLAAFGLRLLDQPGTAAQSVDDAPGLQRVPGAEIGRFLGFMVEELVLNHPAAILVEPAVAGEVPAMSRVALGRYSDGVRAFLVEVQLGRGRVLALADPSVLIDGMLRRYHGDKQFAANLLRWGCYAQEPCNVRLLANVRSVRGAFVPPPAKAAGRNNLLVGLADALRWLATALQHKEMIPVWWALTLALLAGPLLRIARLPPPRRPRPSANAPAVSRLHTTVEAWLSRPEANYQQPARLLAGHLGRMVLAAERDDSGRGAATAAGGAGGARAASPGLVGDDEVGAIAGARGPAAVLLDARPSIARLVARGSLSASAGQRLGEVLTALAELIHGDQDVDRAKFAAIAAEVEWAEHVLSHTAHATGVASAMGTSTATLGSPRRRGRDEPAVRGQR